MSRLVLVIVDEIPAAVLNELLDADTCDQGDMTGPDGDQEVYCQDAPVPGDTRCAWHGGRPGLETLPGSPLGDGEPQAWWLR